jgi:hypothetical protein
MPTSEKQLEIRDSLWYCIGRQEDPALRGTLPTLGYCSETPGTRDCLADADCAGTCEDAPLDWGISSGDVNKVHHDPGWLAVGNPFGNSYVDCPGVSLGVLPIRKLVRDAGLADQIVSVDPRPAPGSPLLSTPLEKVDDPDFVPAKYKGGFNAGNWWRRWSQIWRGGYVAECGIGGSGNTVPDPVEALDILGTDLLRWTRAEDAKTYEALMATSPSGFGSASPVEGVGDNFYDRQADISADPTSDGELYSFLVRAINDCGAGSLGTASSGVERPAP